jgi:hypothetical protein
MPFWRHAFVSRLNTRLGGGLYDGPGSPQSAEIRCVSREKKPVTGQLSGGARAVTAPSPSSVGRHAGKSETPTAAPG